MYDPSNLDTAMKEALKTATDIKDLYEKNGKDKGKCVLVLEDSDTERYFLRRILEDAGYSVIESDSGREFVEGDLGEDFDFVITDISMPEVDGIEVIHAIENSTNKVGALVLSGLPMHHSTVQEVKELAIPFLVKPYSPERLLEVVQNYLGSPIKGR